MFRFVPMGQGTFNSFNPVLGSTPALPFSTGGTGAMGVALHLNADIEADADGDDFGDETQDDCVGSAGPDDGCPVPIVPITTPVTPLTTPATPQTPAKPKRCKKPKKGKKAAAPYAKKCAKKKK